MEYVFSSMEAIADHFAANGARCREQMRRWKPRSQMYHELRGEANTWEIAAHTIRHAVIEPKKE